MNPLNERERLRQELLELHFGCHESPEALEARIASDPAVRALYDEVRGQAGVLEAAAVEPMPELALSDTDDGGTEFAAASGVFAVIPARG